MAPRATAEVKSVLESQQQGLTPSSARLQAVWTASEQDHSRPLPSPLHRSRCGWAQGRLHLDLGCRLADGGWATPCPISSSLTHGAELSHWQNSSVGSVRLQAVSSKIEQIGKMDRPNPSTLVDLISPFPSCFIRPRSPAQTHEAAAVPLTPASLDAI